MSAIPSVISFASQFMTTQEVYSKFFGSLIQPRLQLFLCSFRLWIGSFPCSQISMGFTSASEPVFRTDTIYLNILMMNNRDIQICFRFQEGLRLKIGKFALHNRPRIKFRLFSVC